MDISRFAVIGHPIGHTMSPFIHARLFALSGLSPAYDVLDVPVLSAQLPALRALSGFNITIPHKSAILPFLDAVDEKAALEIHANNVKRVIRALEFYHQTGEKISEHNAKEREKESAYNSAYFVLNDDRVNLYERINKRVDAMFEEGLVEEVTALQERGYTRGMVSMQGLGYKEIFAYLDGECTLEEAKEIIKRDTRHFAKRQITWFKRERDVIWINKQEYGYQEEKILERILKELKVREIFPQKEEEIK